MEPTARWLHTIIPVHVSRVGNLHWVSHICWWSLLNKACHIITAIGRDHMSRLRSVFNERDDTGSWQQRRDSKKMVFHSPLLADQEWRSTSANSSSCHLPVNLTNHLSNCQLRYTSKVQLLQPVLWHVKYVNILPRFEHFERVLHVAFGSRFARTPKEDGLVEFETKRMFISNRAWRHLTSLRNNKTHSAPAEHDSRLQSFLKIIKKITSHLLAQAEPNESWQEYRFLTEKAIQCMALMQEKIKQASKQAKPLIFSTSLP